MRAAHAKKKKLCFAPGGQAGETSYCCPVDAANTGGVAVMQLVCARLSSCCWLHCSTRSSPGDSAYQHCLSQYSWQFFSKTQSEAVSQHTLAYSRWASVKALASQKLLLVDLPDAHPSLCSATQHLHGCVVVSDTSEVAHALCSAISRV